VSDKQMTLEQVAASVPSGATLGIGGWGSRRKPMALVRALLRTDVTDLTVVSYGGPDVGLLCAAGKVRRVVYGFVSLDSIPLEPHFRNARESGAIEVEEYDEGMVQWGLYAASTRMPFFPTRSGLGSDVMRVNPGLRTVADPYGSGEFVAMRPLALDVAFVHANVADAKGNAMFTGPDPYFDDLFCLAAERAYVSVERVVPTGRLLDHGPVQAMRLNRSMVSGVVACPNGAHFTSCVPDYERDESFQREYAASAKSDEAWQAFRDAYLAVDEDGYQRRVGSRSAATTDHEREVMT
jgi:glutaconate CoA-transferase subunit A